MSTGRASREAARESGTAVRWIRQMAPQIAADVVRLAEERSAGNVDALDGRFARLEGSLAGLKASQDASLRELGLRLSDRLEGMKSSMLQVLRVERRGEGRGRRRMEERMEKEMEADANAGGGEVRRGRGIGIGIGRGAGEEEREREGKGRGRSRERGRGNAKKVEE